MTSAINHGGDVKDNDPMEVYVLTFLKLQVTSAKEKMEEFISELSRGNLGLQWIDRKFGGDHKENQGSCEEHSRNEVHYDSERKLGSSGRAKEEVPRVKSGKTIPAKTQLSQKKGEFPAMPSTAGPAGRTPQKSSRATF